jgi:hypothetical protein
VRFSARLSRRTIHQQDSLRIEFSHMFRKAGIGSKTPRARHATETRAEL